MSKILVSITALLLTVASSPAQEVENNSGYITTDGSTVDFHFKGKNKAKLRIINFPGAKDAHWGGIGFMFSGIKGLEDGVNLNQGRSYTVSVNCLDISSPLSNHWVAATGLGFDWSRYHLTNNVSLQDVDNVAEFVWDPDGRTYRDSKFLLYYLKVPLLLEYQIGRNNRIYINGGIEGMLKLYSKSQIEPRDGDRTSKVDLGGFNMFPVTFRFIAGFGYKGLGLTGYYHPLSLFSKGKGPELYPFGAGIILSGY
jgi:hypothetical protein